MNNGTVEASFQELKQGQAPKVVNADEVIQETMKIKLFCYEDEPIFLDDGKPLLDRQGNQRIGRTCIGTRTAKIKRITPIDVYTRALTVFGGNETLSLEHLTQEQLDTMADLILECWKISEPWMTKDELRAGIDGIQLMEVFGNFFFQGSPPQSTRALPDSSTTQGGQALQS